MDIVYTYDGLSRLTDAVYSDGHEFHYQYDAVGNRLSETQCVSPGNCTTTNYLYDDANRLVSVNGQAYTWDDNGNLLSDGAATYSYDSANRLKTIAQGGHTYIYTYNGQGDRLAQSVDGVVTRYTLDLNAGLTQVLADGADAQHPTNTYLYGLGRIGELQPGGFLYHLGDALGSVRQLVDASGEVQLARSYEPYGSVLSSNGSGSSVYAFAGESYDATTGLVFLRARYLSVNAGRFVSRDSWAGDYTRPLSLNRLNYSLSNPVNYTDPTGHSPLWCDVPLIGCVDTAQHAVMAAKAAYSQVGPILLSLYQNSGDTQSFWESRFNCLNPRWSKPNTSLDIVADFFCERGPEAVVFNGSDTLTKEAANSRLLDPIRQEFYRTGNISDAKESRFNVGEFFLALLDAPDLAILQLKFPLFHVLGSVDYTVVKSPSGRVEFQIDNRTDLASGTHIPGLFPPNDERNHPLSLEKVISEHPEMGSMGVLDVLMTYRDVRNLPIVSILSPRARGSGGFFMGGGNLYQTFKWSEQSLDCGLRNLPWPAYLPFLDIR